MGIRNVQFTYYPGLTTVGYRLIASNGTAGSRITSGVSEKLDGSTHTAIYTATVDETSAPAGILWDTGAGTTPTIYAEDDFVSAELSAAHGSGAWGGGAAGLTGAFPASIAWKDANGNAVPFVRYTIIGQGSATADSSGNAAPGLPANGTYTVASSPTNGVIFPSTTLTLPQSPSTLTIAGASVVLPSPASPVEVVGSTTAFDKNGRTVGAVVFEIFCMSNPATGESNSSAAGTMVSASNGVAAWPSFRIGASYQYCRSGGKRSDTFVVPSGNFTLPNILGNP